MPPNISPAAELAQQMEAALYGQVGSFVSVVPDCTASLVFDGTTKTLACNADWSGLAIPFQVAISGTANPLYSLDATQIKGLLLADQVRAAWSNRFVGAQDRTLNCDSAIPAQVLVPMNARTPYRCADDGEISYAELSVVQVDTYTWTNGIIFS